MQSYILFILWLYITICLFISSFATNLYIQSIPMIDNKGTYQMYYFIPLFLFCNYFNKKVYIEN